MDRATLPIIPCLIAGLTLFDRNGAAADAAPPPPPNVILIVAGDLGYADLGCQGARDFDTPQIDRLAREGIRLTSFYSGASTSGASRSALLTGRYPDRLGVSAEFGPAATDGLPSAETTLAELLKSKGYATTAVGLWGLGHQPEFLPTRQGFDHFFGLPYHRDSPAPPLMENDTVTEPEPDRHSLTRRFTERAIQTIREERQHPFFLLFAPAATRAPLFVSPPFSGAARYGLFGDAMEELDWSIGAILETVRDLNLDQKTLIVFTGDNGPWLEKGPHAGRADPLRGGKGSPYEGGIRVPCLMRWPGQLPPGEKRDGIVAAIDLLPTLAALAGAAPAPEKPLDGIDVWPYLTGKTAASPRDTFFYGADGVRRGDWKLLLPGKYQEIAPQPGLVESTKPRLYHLPSDISERFDLSGKKEYQGLIAELTRLCQERKQTEKEPEKK
jgi:arylsulfatase A